MTCPFCSSDMQHGKIVADPRRKLRWLPSTAQPTATEKFLAYSQFGQLTGVTYSMLDSAAVEADFCPNCRKMIFDTDIKN